MFDLFAKQITENQELIVRRYVKTSIFNVEKFIKYLNEHPTVKFDIFKETAILDSNGNIQASFSFLKSYKPIGRDAFIRRLPIYFYDVNHEIKGYCMTDLFAEYRDFYELGNKDSRRESDFTPEMDFNPLYEMIEKIIYSFRLDIESVFEYLTIQFGRFTSFQMFKEWFDYLSILDEINQETVFPSSFFYTVNCLREKKHLPLKIARTVCGDLFNDAFGNDSSCFYVGGYFPVDDNGNVDMKHVGVWCEDVGEISIVSNDEFQKTDKGFMYSDFIGNKIVILKIQTNPKSRIFYLGTKKEKDGMKHLNCWKQIYCGIKALEFTPKEIIKKRDEKKLSQKDVSDAVDINIRSYQRIESGDTTPDAMNLIKLMKFLGINDVDKFTKTYFIYDNESFDKFYSGLPISNYIEEEINNSKTTDNSL